jgi:hypothetical protein
MNESSLTAFHNYHKKNLALSLMNIVKTLDKCKLELDVLKESYSSIKDSDIVNNVETSHKIEWLEKDIITLTAAYITLKAPIESEISNFLKNVMWENFEAFEKGFVLHTWDRLLSEDELYEISVLLGLKYWKCDWDIGYALTVWTNDKEML